MMEEKNEIYEEATKDIKRKGTEEEIKGRNTERRAKMDSWSRGADTRIRESERSERKKLGRRKNKQIKKKTKTKLKKVKYWEINEKNMKNK